MMKSQESKGNDFDQKVYEDACATLKKIMEGNQDGFYMVAKTDNDARRGETRGTAVDMSMKIYNTTRRVVLDTITEALDMDDDKVAQYAVLRYQNKNKAHREGCGCGRECKPSKR